MKFHRCDVADAWCIEPTPHADARGRFMRAWCTDEFAAQGIRFTPVQANMGLSLQPGTMRGMHYQVAPALEAKLVRCTRGALFDVVVDMRPDSPTYRAWFGTELSADNGKMLFVPEGCAHGCLSLAPDTEVHYMVSAVYSPQHVRGLRHDDPAIGVRWPREVTIVSDQDRNWPALSPA